MIRILCVDDDMLILECLKEEFMRCGIENICVETANSFEESKEIIDYYLSHNLKFDYIISDYIMPINKGDEVLLYANKCFPDSKKVLLSGQIENSMIDYLENQIEKFMMVQKPWDKQFVNILMGRSNDEK